jgi:hypothetical protein
MVTLALLVEEQEEKGSVSTGNAAERLKRFS